VNVSAGRVGILSTADDVNITAVNDLKMKAGTPLTFGGIYSDAHFGDIRSDSYKMNLTSTSYTKIHSLGLPAISTQLLPYPDVTHKGVNITSPVLVNIDTLGPGAGIGMTTISGMNVNVNSTVATAISSAAGTVAIKAFTTVDIEALGATNITAGTLVNLGTTTFATATILTMSGLKIGLKTGQEISSLIHPSGPTSPFRVDVKTEGAVNVAPPKIPGTRTSVGYIFGGGKQTRETPNITSRMSDDS
jgi:hypothetical protein